MSVSEYIKQLLSVEEYSFSLDELLHETGKSKTSIVRELARLAKKKEVLSLRKGFYLIIPPRYSKSLNLPIQLYAEKLFNHLNRKYYLGFYSAAKMHGASHQQSQKDYIMIEKPSLIDISKKSTGIRFLTTANWPISNIIIKKSDAGIFKISSPALTAVDLIHNQTRLGGLNRMLAVIEEIEEKMNEQDLANLLAWYPNMSAIQRLGYILEIIGANEKYLGIVIEHLRHKRYYPVLLSPGGNRKPGAVENRWKVDVNIKIESDL